MYSNLLHFRYFNRHIRVGELFTAGDFLVFLPSVLLLINFFDIILLVVFIFFLFSKTRLTISKKVNSKILGLLCILIFLASNLLVMTQTYVTREFHHDIRSFIKAYIFQQHDRLGATLRWGFIPSLLYDVYEIYSQRHKSLNFLKNLNEREAYSISKASMSPMPNILMVQVESLDAEIIGKVQNNIEITPFLNNMKHKYTYFTNFYAFHTSGGGTSDADFSSLTSHYPLGYKPSFNAEGHERLAALPYILKKNGYETGAFHGSIASFWGRSFGFKKIGFDFFLSKSDYPPLEHGQSGFVPDHVFFSINKNKIKEMKEPFFAFLITVSSHFPYNYAPEKHTNKKITAKSEIVNRYFRSINYVDNALGSFVRWFMSKYNNYVIIIYGDHTSAIYEKEYSCNSNKYFEKVPLFIISSAKLNEKQIDTLGTNVDIAPTLLGILNLKTPKTWQGINLMNEERKYLANNKSSYILNKYGDIGDDIKIDKKYLFEVRKFLK